MVVQSFRSSTIIFYSLSSQQMSAVCNIAYSVGWYSSKSIPVRILNTFGQCTRTEYNRTLNQKRLYLNIK